MNNEKRKKLILSFVLVGAGFVLYAIGMLLILTK